MNLRATLVEFLLPREVRSAAARDPAVSDALDESRLVAARIRQWALEVELSRRRGGSGPRQAS